MYGWEILGWDAQGAPDERYCSLVKSSATRTHHNFDMVLRLRISASLQEWLAHLTSDQL